MSGARTLWPTADELRFATTREPCARVQGASLDAISLTFVLLAFCGRVALAIGLEVLYAAPAIDRSMAATVIIIVAPHRLL